MARPTRSKRKAAIARGSVPRKPARPRPASARNPLGFAGTSRTGSGQSAQPFASSGKVPVVAKVGFSAVLILLAVYLVSLGR